MRKLIFILILGLTACTNIPVNQVNDRLQAWKNTNIDELIKYWGVPSRQQQVAGKWHAEWINEEHSSGNTALSVGSRSFGRRSSFGFGLTLFELGGSDDACSRLVTYSENGDIAEISWKGSKNYCYEITPDRLEVIKNKAVIDEQQSKN